MALYDNPFHRADVYSVASGTTYVYTIVQSAVPCIANSLSAGEQLRFEQDQIVVSHRVCFKASALNSQLQRGWKLVVNGSTLRIKGINANQAAGGVPALVEALCEELL